MKKIDSLQYPQVSAIFKNYFTMLFNQRMGFDSRSIFNSDDLKDFYISADESYFPLVVLIGGVAGSGKSSFIQYCSKHMTGVYEESTIKCCKDLVEYMVELEGRPVFHEASYYTDDNTVDNTVEGLVNSIQNKDEKYRALLNRLKTLWCEIDDGPNNIVIDTVKFLTSQNCESCSTVFINVREPEQIDHLKKRLEQECGAIVLTMAVLRNDPTDDANDADKNTLEYNYDIWIKNSLTLEELELAAVHFCATVDNVNVAVSHICSEVTGS